MPSFLSATVDESNLVVSAGLVPAVGLRSAPVSLIWLIWLPGPAGAERGREGDVAGRGHDPFARPLQSQVIGLTKPDKGNRFFEVEGEGSLAGGLPLSACAGPPYSSTLVFQVTKPEGTSSGVFDQMVGSFGRGVSDAGEQERQDFWPPRVDRSR